MPRKRRNYRARKPKTHKGRSSAGRPPIFTPEQKRLLSQIIRGALKEQLRGLARSRLRTFNPSKFHATNASLESTLRHRLGPETPLRYAHSTGLSDR